MVLGGPDQAGDRCVFCRELSSPGPQPVQGSVQVGVPGACRSYSSGEGVCQIPCLEPVAGFDQGPSRSLSGRTGLCLPANRQGDGSSDFRRPHRPRGRYCAHLSDSRHFTTLSLAPSGEPTWADCWQSFLLSHLHPLPASSLSAGC